MLTRGDFCFQDDMTAFKQVANVFQATVEGLTTSHERSLDSQRRDINRPN